MSNQEKTLRLFLGTFPTDPRLEDFKALIEIAKNPPPQVKINWVPEASRHMTWLFLGDVAEHRLDAVQENISFSIAGIEAFPLGFEALALWPGKKQPRMLVWEGTVTPQAEVLHERLNRNLEAFITRTERHPRFRPHITLARIKVPAKNRKIPLVADDLLSAVRLPGTLKVDHIRLVESRMTPRGAIYREIRRFGLAE